MKNRKLIPDRIFLFITKFMQKHGKKTEHYGIWRWEVRGFKTLFFSIEWEVGWFIDRNVYHLSFKMFDKLFYTQTYACEPMP